MQNVLGISLLKLVFKLDKPVFESFHLQLEIVDLVTLGLQLVHLELVLGLLLLFLGEFLLERVDLAHL